MIFIWLCGYAAIHLLRERICMLPCGEWIFCVAIGLYLSISCIFAVRKQLLLYSIRPAKGKKLAQSAMIWAPMLLLPAVNAAFIQKDCTCTAFEMTLMLFAVFAEEVFFRAYLPGVLCRKIPRCTAAAAVFAANAAFAVLHLINLISGADVGSTILQVIGAFFVGMSFSTIMNRTKSIVPAMIIHFLINLSASAIQRSSFSSVDIVSVALAALTYAFIAFADQKYSREKKKNI